MRIRTSLVDSESIFYAYAIMTVLAGLTRGMSLKGTQILQNFSLQTRVHALAHTYGPKPLEIIQKSLILNVNNQRKRGPVPGNGREEDVHQGNLPRGDEFVMASLKRRNIAMSELRSNFVVGDFTSKSQSVTSAYKYMELNHKKMKDPNVGQTRHIFPPDKTRRLSMSNYQAPNRFESYKKLHHHKRSEGNIRYRRHIFPPDNRRRISSYQASHRFPYSASVKISTGCTGTLISNQHVLTAAHCIHNKTHYITPTHTIRVGFLKSNGKFRWYGVTSARFPNDWINSRGARYDYAVLRLSKAHKRKFFRLAEASTSSLRIHFSSFPGDKKRNSLWYVDCTAIVLRLSPNIISQCDAFKGSSGSGVYTIARRRGKNRRVLIGVLSGATANLVKLPNGRSSYFNTAVSLKAADIRDICRWAGSPRGCSS